MGRGLNPAAQVNIRFLSCFSARTFRRPLVAMSEPLATEGTCMAWHLTILSAIHLDAMKMEVPKDGGHMGDVQRYHVVFRGQGLIGGLNSTCDGNEHIVGPPMRRGGATAMDAKTKAVEDR